MNRFFSSRLFSRICLFSAAIIWGGSFFIVKNTLDTLPPHYLICIRFLIGSGLLSLLFWKRFRKIDHSYLRSSVIIGFFLFAAYSVQTLGLTDTTPGKNAFLTSTYCVIVPFLFWIVNKKRPNGYHLLAAFVCIVGIGLVALSETLKIGFGDTLTILCGFFYAAHLVAIAILGNRKDPILLTIGQFFFAGLFSLAAALLFEKPPTQITSTTLWGMFYIIAFATCTALLFQNIGQQNASPASASIILSLESVFGVLFSVLFFGEKLTPRLVTGFVLIFLAVIISETKLSFLNPKRAKAVPKTDLPYGEGVE